MVSIDKIAMAWTIAIVAIGVGFAISGDNLQSSPASESKNMMDDDMMMDNMMDDDMMMDNMMDDDMMMDNMMDDDMMMDNMMDDDMMSEPKTLIVTIPMGVSSPGCEETDECYMPYSASVNVGDTVRWNSDDSAAHTVTSGTPSEGPDGVFNSNLFLRGNSFDVTFYSAGSYDYFCIVHPWMVGNVQVS